MKIALLNDNDEIISYKDKLIVHTEGLLHRAFSIVIFNSNNEILLQKRAPDKYHSGSLWTNTCCSHLPEGNEMSQFIHTRLKQEMGFDCELNFLEKFHYKTTFENGLIENEIDYLYTGKFDGNPSPDISEVS